MNNKERIVIYGVGDTFEKYKDVIKWENVIGIVDGDEIKQNQSINGFYVEKPETIAKNQSMIVIIFSDIYFSQIRDFIINELYIKEESILSYVALLSDRNFFISEDARKFIIYEIASKNILDVDSKIANSFHINCIEQSVTTAKTKALIICGLDNHIDTKAIENFEEIIWLIKPHQRMDENFGNVKCAIKGNKKEAIFLFSNDIIYTFYNEKNNIDIDFFVVTHKEYNCFRNDYYKTIAVGNQTIQADYYSNIGENIENLNPYLNECTAIYWIWRNTVQKYVGLSHYRRYFYNNRLKQRANILHPQYAIDLLNNGYDIILPEMTFLPISMKENIDNAVGSGLSTKVYGKILSEMAKTVPDYVDVFNNVVRGNSLYRCNMFVMHRQLFEKYCTWLFSFLLTVVKVFDYSLLSKQQKRVVGYYAELMLTVWVLKNEISVKELPITDT